MSKAFEPRTIDHLVTADPLPAISSLLLSGYTITTDFIFLEHFTLVAMFTRINILFSLKSKILPILSIWMFTSIEYYVRILPRHLYLLELTLFESPICSFFRKPRQEVTMNVEVVFFSLLFKRHTLILILFQLLCLPRINHYISV